MKGSLMLMETTRKIKKGLLESTILNKFSIKKVTYFVYTKICDRKKILKQVSLGNFLCNFGDYNFFQTDIICKSKNYSFSGTNYFYWVEG